jgi:hypothetical protein
MVLNNFSRRILASTTAAGDRKLLLHFVQRTGAPIHDFADLTIADGIAQANVHGGLNAKPGADCPRIGIMLNTNANDCQLIGSKSCG